MSAMKLKLDIDPDIVAMMAAEVAAGERAVTAAMREAAAIWADARARGVPTAEDEALDGDVILAAQARGFAGLTDTLTVATENVDHLSRYVKDARRWQEITQ